jgi:hypothetical protein
MGADCSFAFGGGDYRLAPGLPCINAGTDAGIYSDIDGEY